MKEITKGISIIAESIYKFRPEQNQMLKGGKHELFSFTVKGCGCCICDPERAASGAGSYTATVSDGPKTKIKHL